MKLPAAALGSIALLHALRAVALFAIGFAVVTVLVRAGVGRLPMQLSTSGVGYGAEETLASKAALNKLQEQVDEQQAELDRAAKRLDAIEEKS